MLYFTCKNLALNIIDCVSLCLSDVTLKAVGPFYLVTSGVYARGSKISHTGGKCVTCCVSSKIGCESR